MPLTIILRPVAEDRAETLVGDRHLSTFDPRTLLAEHPLHLDANRRITPAEYGLRLLAALGGPALLERLAALPRAPHPASALVLRLDDPQLAAIPWEYLHTGAAFAAFEHFLLREVPVAPEALPPAPDPALPWRLVVMASDPLLQELRDERGLLKGYQPLRRLRVASELDALRDALRAQEPPAPLRWQRIAPARDALINLASPEPILFHYTGHGSVAGGQPILCFDDGAGTMRPQAVRDLAVDLRGRTYFAFLNACRTADSAEPGANLALTLVRGGVPAVLGTQASIRDDGAALFAETFYQQLTAGISIEEALYRARLRLADRFSGDPALWGIPAFYRAAGYHLPRQGHAGPPPTPIEPPAPRTEALQAPARLLGRATELTELLRLFVFDGKRVVTIRGPGGMGKTALVHELASRLRFRFRDGITAVTLAISGEQAGLSAAALRAELARRLGLQHPAFDDPTAAGRQEEAIVRAVGGRRALLIFDNYETVLGALGRDAGDIQAHPDHVEADAIQRLVTRLARDGACLLFTTRQAPVELPDEVCYPAAAQGEQLGGLDEASAIALFRQRAGGRRYGEALPGQVARAVGYSPLAIELAAARWAKSGQTEAELLENLDAELLKAEQAGVPLNHRSVLANVGLSIDALSPELRQSLIELALVANPVMTPLHAAVVWGLEDEQQWFAGQAHERLEQLQDRSLLQGIAGRDEERDRANAYAFQPVIAQVVRARAETIDLGPARERYAAWAAGVIGKARGDKGIDFDREVAQATQFYLPDLIAALPYRPAERRGWDAWKLAIILRQFGRVAEAAQVLALAEQAASETVDRKLRQRYLVEAATQAAQRGDPTQALESYQQALTLMGDEDDRQERSATLHAMANVLETRGELDGAMRLYEQSLAIKEALGDVRGKSATLHAMANVLETRGELDGAMRLYEQSLAIKEALGDVRGKSATLHQMAGVLETRGELDGAMRLYEQSLAIKEALGDVRGKSATLHQMAGVLVTRGELDGAMRLYEQSLAIKEALGDVRGKSATLHQMAGVLVTRGELDGAMRLYEQSLAIKEALGDVRGKSATLHQMAGVLVTRGELDGAMRLYEQSLAIKEALGDVRGKAATLIDMAQIQVMRGEREPALAAARASVAIFARLRAPRELAQASEILAQIEAWTGDDEASAATPARLAGALVAMTTAALQGRQPAEQARAALQQVAAAEPALAAYAGALAVALDRAPGAAANLYAAAEPLLDGASAAERADVYSGVANVANALDAPDVEIAVRHTAIEAQREAGADRKTLVQLSVMLYNLAMLRQRQGDFAAAVPLLEEVVALDERTAHPDLEQDRAALDVARQRAGPPPPTLREAIVAWRDGGRGEEQLGALLNEACNRVVRAIGAGTPAARAALAEDLALLRGARPLPLAGAGEFLHVLQLWLRDEPGMAARATQIRGGLPGMFQDALAAIEQLIAGAEPAPAQDDPTDDAALAALAALLEAAPPAQRPALGAALGQTLPIFQAVAAALANPQVGAQERAALADRLVELADQAAAGEAPGSPWLDAAAALRALSQRLRGVAAPPDTLAEPFRTLLGPLLTQTGEIQ